MEEKLVDVVLEGTFRLDESLPTTTLLPPVPQSTRLLRRNYTTLTKYNLSSSIIIRRRHRQIGHGDINKIISQLLGYLLTPRLQRLPTKSRLRRTSPSRCTLIFVTHKPIGASPRRDEDGTILVCSTYSTYFGLM